MTNLGIIAEYNPFHNGHKYHIDKSKEITKADNVIVVMSGNFTQRGLPACCHKFTRCKMALNEGVDIVLELPTFYAASSAEYFAYGSVEILNNCSIIDYLSFGSENGDINALKKVEKFIRENKEEYDLKIKKFLKQGNSYPLAQSKALETFHILDYKSTSNNILAIEYLKALNKLNSTIKPITIKRYGTDYHQLDKWNNFASASAIRNFYKNKDYHSFKDTMPSNSYNIFLESMNNYNYDFDSLSKVFNYIFSVKTKIELLKIVDMNEELYNRIIKARKTSHTISNIVGNVKCKNYTQTRIQRVIANTILNNEKDDFYKILKNGQPYIRVLGFRKDKSHLLGKLVDNSRVPVIINLKNNDLILNSYEKEILKKQIDTTSVYNLCCNDTYNTPCFENQVIIV